MTETGNSQGRVAQLGLGLSPRELARFGPGPADWRADTDALLKAIRRQRTTPSTLFPRRGGQE